MDQYFCDLAEDGAKYGLLCLMTGISEEFWCAGWMMGLEYSLWNAAAGNGQGRFTDRQVTLLKLLAEEADGWWVWSKKDGKPHFVRLETWREMLAKQATP